MEFDLWWSRANDLRERLRSLFLENGLKEGPLTHRRDDDGVLFTHGSLLGDKERYYASVTGADLASLTNDQIFDSLAASLDEYLAMLSMQVA